MVKNEYKSNFDHKKINKDNLKHLLQKFFPSKLSNKSKSIIFITGAGTSTHLNIPDYRSKFGTFNFLKKTFNVDGKSFFTNNYSYRNDIFKLKKCKDINKEHIINISERKSSVYSNNITKADVQNMNSANISGINFEDFLVNDRNIIYEKNNNKIDFLDNRDIYLKGVGLITHSIMSITSDMLDKSNTHKLYCKLSENKNFRIYTQNIDNVELTSGLENYNSKGIYIEEAINLFKMKGLAIFLVEYHNYTNNENYKIKFCKRLEVLKDNNYSPFEGLGFVKHVYKSLRSSSILKSDIDSFTNIFLDFFNIKNFDQEEDLNASVSNLTLTDMSTVSFSNYGSESRKKVIKIDINTLKDFLNYLVPPFTKIDIENLKKFDFLPPKKKIFYKKTFKNFYNFQKIIKSLHKVNNQSNPNDSSLVQIHGNLFVLKCTYCGFKPFFSDIFVKFFLNMTEIFCIFCCSNLFRKKILNPQSFKKVRASTLENIGNYTSSFIHYDQTHPDSTNIANIVNRDCSSIKIFAVIGSSLKVFGVKKMVKNFLISSKNNKGLSIFVTRRENLSDLEGWIVEGFDYIFIGTSESFSEAFYNIVK